MTLPSRQWIALLLPVCGMSLWLLVRTIRSLIRTTRDAVVATLPATAEQTVTLHPGGYALAVESRHFSRDFAAVDFELRDSAGTVIPLPNVLFRTKISSSSRVQLELRRFTIVAAGDYLLRTTGLSPTADSANRLIVRRPAGAQIALHIVTLVVLGILAIGSLVGSIVLWVGVRDAG